MKLFKVENVEAVKGSKHDKPIEELLAAYEEDGTNILPFDEEEESQAMTIFNRMNKAHKAKLDELGVKGRILTVSPSAHKEIYDAGGRKMIALVKIDDNDEEEENEGKGKGKGKNPPI